MWRNLFLWVVLLTSCNENQPKMNLSRFKDTTPAKISKAVYVVDTPKRVSLTPADTFSKKTYHSSVLLTNLVDIQTICPKIFVELKYSSTDNFLGMDVYHDLDRAYLQPDVAKKLVKAQELLEKQRSGYHLLIYDAARPLHIQQRMWDTLRNRPLDRSKYVSNPAQGGSLHNYGAAVDLTIADSLGHPIDMGTAFDYFGLEAHPAQESFMVKTGKLSVQQVANRQLLRSIMRQAGFFGISSEWWHFNSCTRAQAKMWYSVIP